MWIRKNYHQRCPVCPDRVRNLSPSPGRESSKRHHTFVLSVGDPVEVSRYRCPIRWTQRMILLRWRCYLGKTDKWPQINWPLNLRQRMHPLPCSPFSLFSLRRQRLDPVTLGASASYTCLNLWLASCTLCRIIVSGTAVSGNESSANEIKAGVLVSALNKFSGV